MPWTREKLFCRSCREETLHIQKPPNHPLHLLLALATLGIWIVPWVWFSLNQDRPRCSECGSFYTARLHGEDQEDWRE